MTTQRINRGAGRGFLTLKGNLQDAIFSPHQKFSNGLSY